MSPKSSTVTIDTIIKEFQKSFGDRDISLNSHHIWVLNQKEKRFLEIRRKDFVVENSSKLLVTTKDQTIKNDRVFDFEFKQKPTTRHKLFKYWRKGSRKERNSEQTEDKSFLQIEVMKCIEELKDVKVIGLKWQRVAIMMRSTFRRSVSGGDCRKHFHSAYNRLLNYLRIVCSKNRIKSPDNLSLELFRRMQSLDLKLYLSLKSYATLENLKCTLAVRETLDYLLIQTSKASMDVDCRDANTFQESQRESSGKTIDKKRKLQPNKEQAKLDSRLVSVIRELELKGKPYFDWELVRQELSAGAYFCDKALLKFRFEQLVFKYIWFLSFQENNSQPFHKWPLFKKFSKLDLKPFCDDITYETIQRLKERAERASQMNMISVYSQKLNPRNSNQYYHCKYNNSPKFSAHFW